MDPHQFASEFGQLGSGYGQASQGFSPQKSFGLRSLGPAGPVPGVVSQKRLDDGMLADLLWCKSVKDMFG